MKIDYAARSKDRAMYLVAGQTSTHAMPYRDPRSLSDRPNGLPDGLSSLRDLDYLDRSNPLFDYNRALLSAGQFLDRQSYEIPTGTFSRREGVTILTDSGGLQYARQNAVWEGDASREWTLGFAETNGDEAIGLDIPTLAADEGHPDFPTFDACLQVSMENNRYWLAKRSSNTRFLGVLQGRDWDEGKRWVAEAIKCPMDGWAFGGPALRSDYLYLAETLLTLHRARVLGPDRNRIHILGDSTLIHAVMLSALQWSLRHITEDPDLLITFDTSSPTQLVSVGEAYRYAGINKADFNLSSWHPPSLNQKAGFDAPFPYMSSAIAKRISINDLVCPSINRHHGWDTLGNELVTNHNIESLLRAIDDANTVMELPPGWQDEHAPVEVIGAYNALRTMHEYPHNPMGNLRMAKRYFDAIRGR